jgi:type IV pilus assembly protein PilV
MIKSARSKPGNKLTSKFYGMTKNQQGSVLIEALISVLIFSMGILALVGLQSAMLKNTTDSRFRAEASFIAQQRLGEMWADPDNLGNFVVANQAVPTLPNGTRTVTVGANRVVTVTVGWQAPGMDAHRYAASTHISISN